MDVVRISPSNPDDVDRLIAFAGTVLAKCRSTGIHPLAYGSLAYACHLPSEKVQINDIDFLVEENRFRQIAELLSATPGVSHQTTDYHSVKFFRAGCKIAFDSRERYLQAATPQIVTASLNGVDFDLVDSETLRAAYLRGAEKIPAKRAEYLEKARKLTEARP